MKKLSNDIFIMNIFIFLSFYSIYFLLTFFISFHFNSEHTMEIEKLKKFILNEKNEFNSSSPIKLNIDSFIEDIYLDLEGNDNYFINFNYDDVIISKNKNTIKNFNFSKNKIEKIENFKILNFSLFLDKINKNLNIQILYDLNPEIIFIKKVKFVTFIFLVILLSIYIIITQFFYNKLKRQLEILKNMTNSLDLNNIPPLPSLNNLYLEFSNVLSAYTLMIKKIQSQTKSEIDFVNNASHELKTPIFIIGGYAELLEKSGFNNPDIFYESVDAIKSEAKEMAVLTEKLLFIAKKDYTNIFYENIKIKEMIEIIMEEFKIIYPEISYKITGTDSIVLSDQKLLKQLFRNILENSIKYGNNSLIEIILSKSLTNRQCLVAITDSGKGIDENEINNIFSKFYRTDKSRNKSLKGHGLGLSIVKTISELLNIKVQVSSKKNVGTTVSIYF